MKIHIHSIQISSHQRSWAHQMMIIIIIYAFSIKMMLGVNQTLGGSFHKRIKLFFLQIIHLPDVQPSKSMRLRKSLDEERRFAIGNRLRL